MAAGTVYRTGAVVAGGFIVLALALMKGDLRVETQQWVITCMFGKMPLELGKVSMALGITFI